MTKRSTETGKKALTAEEREELLRASWYDHDARWYAVVADAVGIEVANRLNAQALRALGKAEMRRLVAGLGVGRPSSIQELVALPEKARARNAGSGAGLPAPLSGQVGQGRPGRRQGKVGGSYGLSRQLPGSRLSTGGSRLHQGRAALRAGPPRVGLGPLGGRCRLFRPRPRRRRCLAAQ